MSEAIKNGHPEAMFEVGMAKVRTDERYADRDKIRQDGAKLLARVLDIQSPDEKIVRMQKTIIEYIVKHKKFSSKNKSILSDKLSVAKSRLERYEKEKGMDPNAMLTDVFSKKKSP